MSAEDDAGVRGNDDEAAAPASARPARGQSDRPFKGTEDRSKPKRKVCVHVGYQGTNYYGSMVSNDGLPTIEGEVFRALHQWGGVSASNYHPTDPSRVMWSRASRTDRGVHALGAAMSLKLLLPDEVVHTVASTYAGAGDLVVLKDDEVERLNSFLPSDIRVFCVQRVRGSFSAYRQATARRYEYLLPEAAMGPGGPAVLNEVLQSFCGTHAFHNFGSGLRGPDKSAAEGGMFAWKLASAPFKPEQVAFRTVLRCELDDEVAVAQDGTRYHRVLIHGRSFVLHQVCRARGVRSGSCWRSAAAWNDLPSRPPDRSGT